MEDSKKKQIKFEPEYSESLVAKQQPRELSHGSLRNEEEENNRQTTLEEFFYLAGDEHYYDDTQ